MSTREPVWLRSSYSGSSGDNCVEVAAHQATVLVRDSKCTQKRPLSVSLAAWSAFTTLAAGSTV
ncbi:DUF397 domain-containing protein [Streptomyces sp. ADI93-02]|uniref:DUF397 domain-containing protein n=1 Tax=Streptomyces sp. ADI93-02 TaxID=1522757 RepID=UPI000F5513D5|nr:DUF397 domain-containing protein [Streptomyces sp. ADI93-02]RPK49588.1 hypothetical protein EES40_07400 [Streptomyces sp. ADI93-02]